MADQDTATDKLEAARQASDAARQASDAAAQSAQSAQTAADSAQEAATAAEVAAQAAAQAAEAVGYAVGGGIDPFIYRLAIFVLAIFVGYYVVWSVTPALHTPLMSVTNAISSVIVVGALLAVGAEAVEAVNAAGMTIEEVPWTARILGFVALILASVNIFGGFLVTQRMLAMYKKKQK